MNDVDIWPQVAKHGWKYRKRTRPISIVLIHATRGGQRHPTAIEFSATINWEVSPNNIIRADGETYGSMASRIVGGGGRHCIVMPDDYYPAYSAGHIDPIAVSFETCQSNADQPYDERDTERLAVEVAAVCKRYGIPPRNIPYLSGDNREGPGIAYHDRSANGTKYGKSDPGVMFDRVRFERRVQEIVAAGGSMASAEYNELFNRDEDIKKVLARVDAGTRFLISVVQDLAKQVYGDDDPRTNDLLQRVAKLEDGD